MEALSNNAPHLSEETNSIFFRCEFCENVPKIRFSASEPFTLGFFCCYCNTQNFFPLDNFFKLLSKEELNEYVTYSKSNFDFIKEKNKCVTHISKENENYCFQCKTVFCSECSSNHLHHNWININDISLSDSRISKIAYKINCG